MCGITGIIAFNDDGRLFLQKISPATDCMAKRGPDARGVLQDEHIALGHRRLSIIDISSAGAQPMSDPSGRYVIVFNGEFFNYREHRKELISKGVFFKSESDTEVLLQLYIREGISCLDKVNGFFSLAIYDRQEQTVMLARDRFGVKPLYYYSDGDKFIFASELKGILAFGIPKAIDQAALLAYLQLNYVPAPGTMLSAVSKMEPGTWMKISYKGNSYNQRGKYYSIPFGETENGSYELKKKQLVEILEKAVVRRLVSDVPLGAFLSGGLDSSAIVALASRHVRDLNTFSIGFKDEPLFDETRYARLTAERFNTNHTVFSLTNSDLFAHLHEILDYTDEPFADSSAIAVFILCMETRKHVTVTLSGDGADELFAGYNKHRAEWMIRNRPLFSNAIGLMAPLFSGLAGSRNSKAGNRIRQLNRFGEGAGMTTAERYWRWCGLTGETEARRLISAERNIQMGEYDKRKISSIKTIKGGKDMNDVLLTDVGMILPDDMLTKVDRMSMANSLEVRTPFLDFEMVNFAFSLPSDYKIDADSQKKILRDAFRDLLPAALFSRGKQGFEVPLLSWFRTDLKSLIMDDLLGDDFIAGQKIFDPAEVKKLKQQLFSASPGEVTGRIWGLIVFQHWYKKYFLGA